MKPSWRGGLVLALFLLLGVALWWGLLRSLLDLRRPGGHEGVNALALDATAATEVAAETEARLRAALVPPTDPYDLARRLKNQTLLAPDTTQALQPLTLGERHSFWALDLNAESSLKVEAILRYASPLLCVWVEEGLEVPTADLISSAKVFEERIYPTVRHHFGAELVPGIDNHSCIHILNLRLSGASGYFWSADEYPAAVVPNSNEREMFYMNAGTGQPGTVTYDSTLAHELQHMVHWKADSNEDAWISEGLSELAELLCGYSKANRIATYASDPDIGLTQWSANDGRTSGHYSASFLFAAYLSQRYGAEGTRLLVASGQNGPAGVDSVLDELGTGLTFEDLFADWIVANYVDGTGSDPARYSYTNLDLGVLPQATLLRYPAAGEGMVQPFGTDYLVVEGNGEALRLSFLGEDRAQLVPADPPSGRFCWWSNRGDSSDMTLTRGFDLRGLREARLHLSMWYDIEDGWDYAYVEASMDGGATWRILPGRHTTERNPTGQSYGPAYTGLSANEHSQSATWQEEIIDLSSLVGQEVLIRFEYITDDAVNGPGLCLDDIRIPELGYSYDAEDDDGGWIAEGFVRIDNWLRRRYLIQAIRVIDRQVSIERFWVSGGTETIVALPDIGQSTVISISDVTRYAVASAGYSYSLDVVAQE